MKIFHGHFPTSAGGLDLEIIIAGPRHLDRIAAGAELGANFLGNGVVAREGIDEKRTGVGEELARLYREAPLNAIWEGSGNVMCLDVLRALKRDDEMALIAGLAGDAGIAASNVQAPNESDARSFVERLAILASASALRSSAPAAIADAFMKTRFANRHGAIYGASNLDESTVELLLQRVLPEA